jgi:hypothetical protein
MGHDQKDALGVHHPTRRTYLDPAHVGDTKVASDPMKWAFLLRSQLPSTSNLRLRVDGEEILEASAGIAYTSGPFLSMANPGHLRRFSQMLQYIR